jgi:hypothetical protein
MNEKDLKRIFSNPFYCLPKVDEIFATEHEPLVTEEVFIKSGVKLIEEIGSEEYLKNLLENLKGNFVK